DYVVVVLSCSYRCVCFIFFFFFQAEDGIRDLIVTGVQTCALPICSCSARDPKAPSGRALNNYGLLFMREGNYDRARALFERGVRSEERRVGKECRSRWSASHKKKEKKITMSSLSIY